MHAERRTVLRFDPDFGDLLAAGHHTTPAGTAIATAWETSRPSPHVSASREYLRRNPEGGVPFEQVVDDLGLAMEQVRGHKGH